MKKSLIALGVAAGMFSAAHADTTNLYGALGFHTKFENNGEKFGDSIKENIWDLSRQASRFGIKGTEDLSNGLQAFFKFELDVDANGEGGANKTRYAYIGFEGDSFGKVTLGRQISFWGDKIDVNNFNSAFVSAAEFDKAPGRVGKAISYVSPSFGGFQFGGAIQINGDNHASKGVDAYEAAALYNNYGVDASFVYTNIKERTGTTGPKDTTEYLGLNVGYEMKDTFSVNFGAAHKSSVGKRYNLQGEYFLGANTFRAGVNYADNKSGADPMTFALGYQYNFSKRTYVWVEGDYTDYDVPKSVRDNGYRVFVGARHNF